MTGDEGFQGWGKNNEGSVPWGWVSELSMLPTVGTYSGNGWGVSRSEGQLAFNASHIGAAKVYRS